MSNDFKSINASNSHNKRFSLHANITYIWKIAAPSCSHMYNIYSLQPAHQNINVTFIFEPTFCNIMCAFNIVAIAAQILLCEF